MYTEEDYLLISGIQHFAFCRRQWALIHIEQQWAENYQTTSGELFHKKAHSENSIEKRGDLLIVRGMQVSSARLGMTGQCDVVEFHKSKEGIAVQKYDGLWSLEPVEYKRGKPKDGEEDTLQLCLQAICLEEMFLTEIHKGYLFYGENRRRTEVVFTPQLRQQVEAICKEMHELYQKGYTPRVKTDKKCGACSLQELCMPKLQRTLPVETYINKALEDIWG